MFWQITSFPRCEYHVFLSHCAADRDQLVHPVYEELKRRGIIPWLDRDDYCYGRNSRASLRDGLLRSRHIVFFITLGMLDYRRGWCPIELAYSDLIQSNLNYTGGCLLNVELPLFFVDRDHSELRPTAWDSLRDHGVFHTPSAGPAVDWAVNQIMAFLKREQKLAQELAMAIAPGTISYQELAVRPGLMERVRQFDPADIV